MLSDLDQNKQMAVFGEQKEMSGFCCVSEDGSVIIKQNLVHSLDKRSIYTCVGQVSVLHNIFLVLKLSFKAHDCDFIHGRGTCNDPSEYRVHLHNVSKNQLYSLLLFYFPSLKCCPLLHKKYIT